MRLGDVFGAWREDVEDEATSIREQRGDRAQDSTAVRVGLHVQQRAKRDQDERKLALDRRSAHVAVAQVELDTGEHCTIACDLEHPGREVDSDHLDSGRGDRYRNSPGADAELEHRPARTHGLLDVERDVLDDAP